MTKTESGKFDVNLSKLFLWYGADFGGTPDQIVTWIAEFVDKNVLDVDIMKTGFNIVHRDYNWSSNLND